MSDRESSAVGYRLRIQPTDLSTYPDRAKLVWFDLVVKYGLVAKLRDLRRGKDKNGNIHPLAPRTIKYRRSEVGPVTKTAPRGIPALDLSRVMSLLVGRAHTSSAEFWWKFDAVSGRSFATILHYWADEQGHDVFGLSAAGRAWTLAKATADWEAWKASPEAARLTAGRPGIPAARQVRKTMPEVMGRTDIENFDLFPGAKSVIEKAISEGRFTGFRRLNARGEQWKSGPGGRPGPIPPKPKPVSPPPAKPILARTKPAPALQTFESEINAMLAKRQLGQSGLDAIKTIMAKHAVDVGEHQLHGMSHLERFRVFEYAGIRWHFSESGFADQEAAKAIKEFYGRLDQIPERLRKVTTEIWFANQKNKQDAFWRETYKHGAFGAAAATGGDGRIVVYEFGTLPVRRFAHESGHNLATNIYGDVNPRGTYLDVVLNKSEPPVSDYAKNSPAEDFAEACRLYVEDIDELKARFPVRYSIIHKLMTDPNYGG